jgi:hypothetical protein
MTSEPLTDIMDMVGSFKEKHKQLREVHSGHMQSILAYFSEIRKHREIALSNHYKMLFEFVSEVDSPNIHVQVLAQVHKHMEMGLLGPVLAHSLSQIIASSLTTSAASQRATPKSCISSLLSLPYPWWIDWTKGRCSMPEI